MCNQQITLKITGRGLQGGERASAAFSPRQGCLQLAGLIDGANQVVMATYLSLLVDTVAQSLLPSGTGGTLIQI